MRPFKEPVSKEQGISLLERDILDLQLTVDGLSKLFIKFLYKYQNNSANIILSMLITHLKCHYKQPMILEHFHTIRYVVSFEHNTLNTKLLILIIYIFIYL